MKCPSEMQKSSTLGSQGTIVAVAVSIVGIGIEVDVGVCVATGMEVARAVEVIGGGTKVGPVEQDERMSAIWSLASLLANVRELAPVLQSLNLEYTFNMEDIYKTYPHNPPHYFVPNAMYIVTGSLLYKKRLLTDNNHKSLVCDNLFEIMHRWGWALEAWSVLENHYHFIARSPEDPLTLEKLIRQLHSKTAMLLNKLDKTPGRQVWYNYWDTCITHETSYYARLHYVHINPVKHGLVENAEDYPFGSYRWFLDEADESFRDKVINQPINRVDIFDDFD
jgi:putative transposase